MKLVPACMKCGDPPPGLIESRLKDEEFYVPTRLSVSSQFQEPNNERRWRMSYLKDQFVSLELDKLFDRYSQRISHGYFSQFLTLQILLVTTHFGILLGLSLPQDVLPDLILYGVISLLSIIILILTDTFVKRHPKLLKVFAGAAFFIIFFMNFFVPYYYLPQEIHLRPGYTTYLVISNYIFLNVHNDLVAVVLGVFVSIFHIVTLTLVTYVHSDRLYQRLGSDVIYLLCINGFGVHFRYMNEIVIRRSFLDRRACVESTYQLKFEEEQENQLMTSIIPQQIIARVRKDIVNYYLHPSKNSLEYPFEKPLIDHNSNVTILFADIVNYTAMTTKLDKAVMLDILNELFGRFDDASADLKVLRIKFLGDCYYCVAGLPPDPAPNHADACVDFGLEMISIVSDIRERYTPLIDMRIGVHSGSISSGIVGVIKWQYDIWSTDVDIANKMETEGVPGMVHITEETRKLLHKTYAISKTDKIINNAPTYLISSKTANMGIARPSISFQTQVSDGEPVGQQRRSTIFVKRPSGPLKTLSTIESRSISLNTNRAPEELVPEPKRHTLPQSNERRLSGNPILNPRRPSNANKRMITNKRRTAFMNNNIKRYKERLEVTNKELEETIEQMRLSKYEQWFKKSEIYKFFMVFKDSKSEMDFIKTPDPLFKYYILSEIFLVLLIYILQNLTTGAWGTPDWPFFVTLFVLVSLCLPLTWTHFIWNKFVVKSDTIIPKNSFVRFLYNASKFITNNVATRIVIYTGVFVLVSLCVLTEWVNCSQREHNPTTVEGHVNFLSLMLQGPELKIAFFSENAYCKVPWHMTETCALAIITSFLFLRMYMWLKCLYAIIITSVYSFCIFQYGAEFYGESQTFNYLLDPKVGHLISVVFLTIVLHFVDRQTEYMNRLDHLWYRNLGEKEKEAESAQAVNRGLLENILPIHVAQAYLNLNRNPGEELFQEKYLNVAVMFASVMNFKAENFGSSLLSQLHDIISEFDKVLVSKQFGRPIEKIKIAKWTYMSACGLDPGKGEIGNLQRDNANHVVICLLKFAVAIMQLMENTINAGNQQEMKLRIGISHGPVSAGVIGSKKPLYDIWGDPVNMASRMETTGLMDRIQVLKETADVIREYGYKCSQRGLVCVKGRDNPVQTYFVDLDKDLNLVPINTND